MIYPAVVGEVRGASVAVDGALWPPVGTDTV